MKMLLNICKNTHLAEKKYEYLFLLLNTLALPGALSPSGCPSGWLPEEALAEELAIELPKELPEELPEALSEELPGVLPGAWPSCAKASACAGSMVRQIAAASTALNRRCFHRMC